MIRIYGMASCPDCSAVWEQVKGNPNYEVIDFGQHIRLLKEFLKLRDNEPAFAEAKAKGYAGVPCFVLEDGTVTLDPKAAGLRPRAEVEGAACNIDGSGC